MGGSSQSGGRTRRRVDPVLVIALAGVVGLLAGLRADLEVGATALVLGIAGLVGVGVGVRLAVVLAALVATDAPL